MPAGFPFFTGPRTRTFTALFAFSLGENFHEVRVMPEQTITARDGSNSPIINAQNCGHIEVKYTVEHHHHYHQNCGEYGQPSMDALKRMIDVVIATTSDAMEAARLELCRAYLFTPLLGGKIENFLLEQIGTDNKLKIEPVNRRKNTPVVKKDDR